MMKIENDFTTEEMDEGKVVLSYLWFAQVQNLEDQRVIDQKKLFS